MKIQIMIKTVYGVDKFYPADELAYKFANLIGAKTFNINQLKIIKSMGYEIEEVQLPKLGKL